MKKYIKEIFILFIQLLIFYIFPAFATDAMGMVFLMILATLILAIILSSISKEKIKYLYPIIIALVFIPSVFIYYNESALIHSIWYLVISIIGIFLGTIISKVGSK